MQIDLFWSFRSPYSYHEAGHWGVPTRVFEGEPFFGEDRLDVLLWRLKQKGLRPRASTGS